MNIHKTIKFILPLTLLAISNLFASGNSYRLMDKDQTVNVRNQPKPDSKIVDIMFSGECVVVDTEENGWRKIRSVINNKIIHGFIHSSRMIPDSLCGITYARRQESICDTVYSQLKTHGFQNLSGWMLNYYQPNSFCDDGSYAEDLCDYVITTLANSWGKSIYELSNRKLTKADTEFISWHIQAGPGEKEFYIIEQNTRNPNDSAKQIVKTIRASVLKSISILNGMKK